MLVRTAVVSRKLRANPPLVVIVVGRLTWNTYVPGTTVHEKAVSVAEDAFQQAGKRVTIKHDSNLAMILNISGDEGKCGIIVRGPNRTTTFNITARPKEERDVKPSHCLTAAAAFLEGIQLAFLVGMTRQKIRHDILSPTSPEAKQADDAGHKLGRLNGAIAQLEKLLDIKYRPDKPEFSRMIDEAEEFARKVLSPEIKKNVRDDPNGWVK